MYGFSPSLMRRRLCRQDRRRYDEEQGNIQNSQGVWKPTVRPGRCLIVDYASSFSPLRRSACSDIVR